MSDDGMRRADRHARAQQRFGRQVHTAQIRVFVDIAQDIGQLQRAAEVMRQRYACIKLHAEHAHGKAPYRTGHAVAIKIQRGVVRRADIGVHVHGHAIDDGEEILLQQPEALDLGGQPARGHRRRAGIARGKIGAPGVEPGKARGARAIAIGNIVHRTAKAIDLEHRLALRSGQDLEGGMERAAGRYGMARLRDGLHCDFCSGHVTPRHALDRHAACCLGLACRHGPARSTRRHVWGSGRLYQLRPWARPPAEGGGWRRGAVRGHRQRRRALRWPGARGAARRLAGEHLFDALAREAALHHESAAPWIVARYFDVVGVV